MKQWKNQPVSEDTRQEVESVTEQTKVFSEEIRGQVFLANPIFDAIR